MNEWLDSQEFYELMQAYRHAPIGGQANVVAAFNAVKEAILKNMNETARPND